jgi:hypothetical protein
MDSQKFAHENELLALARLDSEEDLQLFKAQQVNLVGEGNVQWDFILHNGADFHFRQPFFSLMHYGAQKACKNEIRARLKNLAADS